MTAVRDRRPSLGARPPRAARVVILVVVGALFAIPLLAMLEFTLRGGMDGGHDLGAWIGIVDPENARAYRPLFQGIGNSLVLALGTVVVVLVLLLPTMLLVELRLPRLRRALELICLVPITVPAIVLVVGLAPVYSVVSRIVGSATWTLAFAYGITVLPYAYRAIQANLSTVPVATLSEAARTLGASRPRVFFGVLLPLLRRGVLAAAFITVAVVLGEYTIASLLNRTTLQTGLVQVSRSDAAVAVVFSLLALVLAFTLLLSIGRLSRERGGRTSRS